MTEVEMLEAFLQNYGLPVTIAGLVSFILYKVVKRIWDEFREREKRMLEERDSLHKLLKEKDEKVQEQDNKFAEVGKEYIACMKNVEGAIEKYNETNKALAETNRLLVDKMDGRIDDIDGKLDILLDRINRDIEGD